MNFLSSRGTKPLLLAAILFTAVPCAWPTKARGQAQAEPQSPRTAPAQSQPLTQSQTSSESRRATAVQPLPPASLDLHALIAQFGDKLRAGGARDVVVVSGLWPESGKNAFQDWLVAQVKNVLTQEANGLDVAHDYAVGGLRSGEILLSTDGIDTVVSASAYPGAGGIQITLNAQPARAEEHEPERDASIARVSQAIPLTNEMTALLPSEWKKQIEEERNEIPKIPLADEATVSKMPTCVSCSSPSYTRLAKQFKVVGSVSVMLTVEADGTANDIQLVRGLGFGLDEAAVEAVSHWRFSPALDKTGKPIATRVNIEVAYKLL